LILHMFAGTTSDGRAVKLCDNKPVGPRTYVTRYGMHHQGAAREVSCERCQEQMRRERIRLAQRKRQQPNPKEGRHG